MIILWVILSIIALLLVLLVLIFFAGKLKLIVSYSDTAGLSLSLYALFVKVFDTNKKNSIRHKKSFNSRPAKSSTKGETSVKQKKFHITKTIQIIRNTLQIFFDKYAHHISVKATKINIAVAANDAASTAILYGVVSQGVAYILELIDNLNNLKPIKNSSINIYTDYTAEKTSTDIKLSFSLPIRITIPFILDSKILELFL